MANSNLWIDLLAYGGGIFLMFSFLPQVIQSAMTKKTRDIAWGLLFCSLASGILYEIYSVALNLVPVIIMNGIFCITVLIQMGLKFVYDRRV